MSLELAQTLLTCANDSRSIPERENLELLDALVTRVLNGDELAFERIMLTTERRVVSIAWRILGNRDDASDAAQEVYLRVYKYLGRFRQGEDFRAWINMITVNVCRDIERKKKDRGLTQISESQFNEHGPQIEDLTGSQNPESLTLRQQRIALMNRAIQSLPPKERLAFVLRELEGFSTEEVAKLMGTRPVTVRSQVSAARLKIHSLCEKLLRKRSSSK